VRRGQTRNSILAHPRTPLADLVRRATRAAPPGDLGRLNEIPEFGPNPGQLRAIAQLPPGGAAGRPLVVVLHGCQQDAASFAQATGWTALADRHDFALLAPAQRAQNNPNNCFNWFEPLDQGRQGGEAESVASMVRHMIATQGVDADRVYVTGLSAGGAMAAILLATYPEMFAAGAIVAGLPYAVATSVPEAFAAMRGDARRSPAQLAALVRNASPHTGPWPRVAIWQGDADTTVFPANAEALWAQWGSLHAVAGPGVAQVRGAGHRHREWHDRDGAVVVERHDLSGFGHAVPIDAAGGHAGSPAPFILEAGVASTEWIAAFFGIAPPPTAGQAPGPAAGVIAVGRDGTAQAAAAFRSPPQAGIPGGAGAGGGTGGGVGETIRRALTAAGLLRP